MSTVQHVPVTITEPGMWELPAELYHADPVPGGSLSSSTAKLLLPPHCPAHFHHWMTEGRFNQPHVDAFDLGLAAHTVVLGVGRPITRIDEENWRTKRAREQRDEIKAAGGIPLLTADYDVVLAMAAKLREHPIAGQVLAPGRGWAERSIFWVDYQSGVWRRAMLDWIMPTSITGGKRLLVVDFKSADSAEPEHLSRALVNFGYAVQGAWYLDAVAALDLGAGDEYPPAFLHVTQEKSPPYVVTVSQPDDEAIEYGRVRNRRAIEVYRHCRDANHWPGYAEDVISIPLPAWAASQHRAAMMRDYNDSNGAPR